MVIVKNRIVLGLSLALSLLFSVYSQPNTLPATQSTAQQQTVMLYPRVAQPLLNKQAIEQLEQKRIDSLQSLPYWDYPGQTRHIKKKLDLYIHLYEFNRAARKNLVDDSNLFAYTFNLAHSHAKKQIPSKYEPLAVTLINFVRYSANNEKGIYYHPQILYATIQQIIASQPTTSKELKTLSSILASINNTAQNTQLYIIMQTAKAEIQKQRNDLVTIPPLNIIIEATTQALQADLLKNKPADQSLSKTINLYINQFLQYEIAVANHLHYLMQETTYKKLMSDFEQACKNIEAVYSQVEADQTIQQPQSSSTQPAAESWAITKALKNGYNKCEKIFSSSCNITKDATSSAVSSITPEFIKTPYNELQEFKKSDSSVKRFGASIAENIAKMSILQSTCGQNAYAVSDLIDSLWCNHSVIPVDGKPTLISHSHERLKSLAVNCAGKQIMQEYLEQILPEWFKWHYSLASGLITTSYSAAVSKKQPFATIKQGLTNTLGNVGLQAAMGTIIAPLGLYPVAAMVAVPVGCAVAKSLLTAEGRSALKTGFTDTVKTGVQTTGSLFKRAASYLTQSKTPSPQPA